MPKKRSAVYDNVKFFLILCVVLGHIGNSYAEHSHALAAAQFWIYLFHMPAFVFVAGLFSKRTVREKRWDKAVPYLFIVIFMMALSFLISTVKNGKPPADLGLFDQSGVAWFAMAMFWWYAAAILVRRVHPAYVLTASVLLAMVVGYSSDIGKFLALKRAFVFFPFFYAGYLLDPEKLRLFLRKPWVRIVAAAVVLVTVFVSFRFFPELTNWRRLFKGSYDFSAIKTDFGYEWGFLWRAAAYVISSVLTLSVISLTPDIHCFISKLGTRTLAVFVFHSRFLALIPAIPFLKNFFATGGFLWLKCLVLMVVLTLFCSLKPFVWIVDKIMKVPHIRPKEALPEAVSGEKAPVTENTDAK